MTYQLWAFTQAGEKAAVLEKAFGISLTKEANAASALSFSIPSDDAKTPFITTAYEIKVWNTIKSRFEGLFTLEDATDQWSSSGKTIACQYIGAMGQLTDEENVSYDTGATPLTPTAIITALLALQERTPAITVGTIEPTTTFCIAVENVTLMKAVSECVSYIGGYIEVDEDRHFNWYNEPSGNPTREIRYQKNMKGVTRKRDFTSITNKLYAYGYGETEAQVTLIDAGEAYEYIEDATSEAAYGVHPRRITDKRITHPSTLLAWAQKVLAEYKDPIYSYTVDAVNLAVHPDHTFDLENLEVGQIVRVVNSDLIDPLTGLGLNVNVKIVKVTTNLSNPQEISLELANATKSLADLISSSADTSSIVNNIAVQIGAGQVTVMGTFTVDGWRTTGTTTIDGGNITAGSITITGCDFAVTQTFCQDTAPTAVNTGDLWVDSDDTNKLYRWSGAAWVLVTDTDIAQAISDASAAAGAAADAQADATAALGTLSDMANDGKITPDEKPAIKAEWDIIVAEVTPLDAQATAFSVDSTDYDAQYGFLEYYLGLSGVFTDMGATTDITRTEWDYYWGAYYAERTALLNAISAKAKEIADGKIEAGGAAADINAGVTTINGGQITTNTIDADAIKTSTLNAKTITLGTTGGDSIIKSGNYSAGSAGWQIKANGDAEFNNVTVRGTIATSTIGAGSTVSVAGAIQSSNYSLGTDGWKLGATGAMELNENLDSTASIYAESGSVVGLHVMTDAEFTLSENMNGANVLNRSIYTNDGIHLKWKDSDGNTHDLY